MVSQLGKNLLQPEPGWTREYCTLENAEPGKFFSNVALNNINTGDKWRAVGDSDSLERNSAWYIGAALGRSFYFKFTGNAVRILLKNFTTHAFNIEVTIDGIRYPGSVPAYSSDYSLVVFEKLDLFKGEHNVKVTTAGKASGEHGTSFTLLTAIDYADLIKVGDVLKNRNLGGNGLMIRIAIFGTQEYGQIQLIVIFITRLCTLNTVRQTIHLIRIQFQSSSILSVQDLELLVL